MAKRRMFSQEIVDTDVFLEMPVSSQLLYFQLGMRADDDGFVNNPKKIMRMINVQADDLKILLAKRFLLEFDSGVVVIKHWRINNYIQNDRYTASKYTDERKKIAVKDNGSYTDRIQDGYKLDAQVRLGKVRQETQSAKAVENRGTNPEGIKRLDEIRKKFNIKKGAA